LALGGEVFGAREGLGFAIEHDALEFVGGKVLFIATDFDHDLIAIFFDDLSGDRRPFDWKNAVSILGLDGYRD
jgi:hypothetical protein